MNNSKYYPFIEDKEYTRLEKNILAYADEVTINPDFTPEQLAIYQQYHELLGLPIKLGANGARIDLRIIDPDDTEATRIHDRKLYNRISVLLEIERTVSLMMFNLFTGSELFDLILKIEANPEQEVFQW